MKILLPVCPVSVLFPPYEDFAAPSPCVDGSTPGGLQIGVVAGSISGQNVHTATIVETSQQILTSVQICLQADKHTAALLQASF